MIDRRRLAAAALLVCGCPRKAPHQEASPAAPESPPAQPVTADPLVPVVVAPWLAAPGRVFSTEGTTLVGAGVDLLIERGDVLQQDGIVARVPGCRAHDVRDVVDVAGTWPDDVVMLRAVGAAESVSHRLYRWHGARWRELETLASSDPLLATVQGGPWLVARTAKSRGYSLRDLGATARTTRLAPRTSNGECGTALAEPHGARGNARGDLVVWGAGCTGDAGIEVFSAGASESQLTHWSGASIAALDLDEQGRMIVARVGNGATATELLVSHAAGWNLLTSVEGRVGALADLGEDGVYIVVDTERPAPRFARFRDVWTDLSLGEELGTPRSLARARDGSLWITTEHALVRTRPSAYEWWLVPTGCDPATVEGAKTYRFRDRRPAQWDCPGSMFVSVGTTSGDAPRAWRDLIAAMPEHVELGFRAARRDRLRDAGPPEPGVPIEPVVAHELADVRFGFALHGGDDITELALTDVHAKLRRLGHPAPAVVCADPPGLPESEVRRLAAP